MRNFKKIPFQEIITRKVEYLQEKIVLKKLNYKKEIRIISKLGFGQRETYALSFYRSQNILCWSKYFVPDQ